MTKSRVHTNAKFFCLIPECFEDKTGENCSKNDNQVAKSQLLQLDNDMSITSNNTSTSTENNGKKSKNFSEKSNCISRIEATTTPASTNKSEKSNNNAGME